MKNITHFIDGQQIETPRDWMEFGININFSDSDSENSSQKIEFVGDANTRLRDIIESGLTGGAGIFEGVPYTVRIEENGFIYNYEAYIDLSSKSTFVGNESIITTIKRRQGEDWINEVADGFSLSSMQQNGEISQSDYTEIRYVINSVPDVLEVATLSLSIFVLTAELLRMKKEFTIKAPKIVADAAPKPGTFLVFDPANVWYNIFRIIIEIAVMIAMLIAIVKMSIDLLNALIPSSRIHMGIGVRKKFELCCKHLDLTLDSTLLDSLQYYTELPVKNEKGKVTDLGIAVDGASGDSFGDIIRSFMKIFNADYRISNGVFKFERLDFFQKSGNFVMPDIFTDQDNLRDNFFYNTEDFVSNYNINFRFDPLDENTLNGDTGIAYQSSLLPIKTTDKKLVNMKGLSRVDVPYALGVRKEGLTDVEKDCRVYAKIVDVITGVFGKGTNMYNNITERDGALLLTSHSVSIPKLINVKDRVIIGDITSKLLWDKYHFINSFSPDYEFPNQWKIFEDTRIPIDVENVMGLIENNYGKDADGMDLEITKLDWKPMEDVAIVNYRKRYIYTTNLKELKYG